MSSKDSVRYFTRWVRFVGGSDTQFILLWDSYMFWNYFADRDSKMMIPKESNHRKFQNPSASRQVWFAPSDITGSWRLGTFRNLTNFVLLRSFCLMFWIIKRGMATGRRRRRTIGIALVQLWRLTAQTRTDFSKRMSAAGQQKPFQNERARPSMPYVRSIKITNPRLPRCLTIQI